MEEKFSWKKWALRILSYVLVATLTCFGTLFLCAWSGNSGYSKLDELKNVIMTKYIGQKDEKELEDMAAAGMVAGTGDRWSYYIPADQLQTVMEQKANSYVGIGVTITILEEDQGFEVNRIEPGSPAQAGGIQVGDVIVGVEGQSVKTLGSDEAQNRITGEAGTQVTITVLRDGQQLELTLIRQQIVQQVATGKMLNDTVGYIRIRNFNERCAQDTIALVEELEAQGAQAMIFDVRFNGGGYKDEMVEILDYLLPEGVLFRSQDYAGRVSEDTSDASCKNMPMAVLINGESYSAAEFFAAALKEYDYAFTVGQPTTGKGYFQNTLMLSDGSAVNLSVGKYFTPKGVSLAEVGGLVPDVTVEIDQDTMDLIYMEQLPLEEDTQLQTALEKLQEG